MFIFSIKRLENLLNVQLKSQFAYSQNHKQATKTISMIHQQNNEKDLPKSQPKIHINTVCKKYFLSFTLTQNGSRA